MKKTRLLEIIREEIAGALREGEAEEKAAKAAALKATDLEIAALQKKKAEMTKSGVAEAEDLNEIPDFGGKLDQGVAKEFGEKNTLQNAVDKIVDETLADMGVTLEDLKKDKTKATEALTSIREKVLGAKRKNIPQDPRVIKALEKQEDIEVATLGAISGKSLQQNQTDNAIKKALGLVTPDKRGRKALEKPAEEKPAKEKAPKAEKTPKTKVATRTKGDDGFDTVEYSDVEDEDVFDTETAPAGDKEVEKAARNRDELIKQYKTEVEPELKDKIAKAKSGDTEAMSWLKSKQDIIKKYNQAKQVNA